MPLPSRDKASVRPRRSRASRTRQPYLSEFLAVKKCSSARREAADRALASAESVKRMDLAATLRTEAVARARAARRLCMQADAAQRAASAMLGACIRQVKLEARQARSKGKTTAPIRARRAA